MNTELVDRLSADADLRIRFLLSVLHYITIDVRNALNQEALDSKRLSTLNQASHRILPIVRETVEDPGRDQTEFTADLLTMLERAGLSHVVSAAWRSLQQMRQGQIDR